MQLLLPLFTTEVTLITPTIGVAEHDGFVYYLQNGVPINTHHKDDIKGFRYITSMLIDLGRCRQSDIVRSFHVSTDSVSRALKRYKQKAQTGMFEETDNRHGVSHKLFGERLERVQKMLDKGMSNYSIAKKEQITEGAIRYAIKMGKLKKKFSVNR
jgi:predicted transcriptional regulator